VILSARIIPGNEKAIFRMLDHMFRKRALVYYDNDGGRSTFPATPARKSRN
jgi:mRNA degradation ribonuclease J1/J2